MASPVTLEEIEAVTDLGQARALSKRFNPKVSLAKCEFDKQKERLRLAVKKCEGKMKDVDALGQVMKQQRQEDQYQRELLIKYFDQFKEILGSMDDKMKKHIERKRKEEEPEKEIERICAKLKIREHKLIVAGETSSGKSTLLNIFLSDFVEDKKPLLPAKLLSCTATVCEMTYSDAPAATVVKRDKEEPIDFDERDKFIFKESSRDRKFDHDCVRLKIPSFLLKTGITLVDTPGVSENEEMGSILKDYVMHNEPFGFVFTIASNRAGGVLDKFQNLLLDLSSQDYVDDFGQRKFDSRSCIFVANFWDEVKGEKEREETKQNIYDTLSKMSCMANFNPETQVFFLDADFAFHSRSVGYITDDFSQFIDGIGSFVWKEQRRKLKLAYRLLQNSVQRILHPLRSYIKRMQQNPNDRSKNRDDTTKTIDDIEKRLKKDLADHRKQLAKQIEQCSAELMKFFSHEKTVKRVQEWRNRDLPKEQFGDDWVLIEVKLDQAIDSRVSDMLKDWERECQVITNCEKNLLDVFIKNINKYTDELDEVERKIRSESGEMELSLEDPASPVSPHIKEFAYPTSQDESGRQFGVKQGETYGYAIMAYPPETEKLLDSVSSGPVLRVLKRRSKKKGELKESSLPNGVEEYLKDKVGYMQQRAYRIFATMCNKEYALSLVAEQLNSVETYIELSEKETSKVIETNRRLLEAIAKEKRKKNEIERLYVPIENRASALLEEVLSFGQKYIIDPSIQRRDIVLTDSLRNSSLFASLCKGRWADDYIKKYKRKSKKEVTTDITLKAILMKPSEKNLQQSYISKYASRFSDSLRYHGTYNLNGELTLIFHGALMTAREYFFKFAKGPRPKDDMNDFLSLLVSGLQFLHLKNLVHPEVSLDSVLIKATQTKMSPILSNLQEPNVLLIPTTDCPVGGYIHLPPEVLHWDLYTWRADVYGVGVIMIELWYQKDVFAELKSTTHLKKWMDKDDTGHSLLKESKQDHKQTSRKMNEEWKSLVKKCLTNDPDSRINVADWHAKWIHIVTGN